MSMKKEKKAQKVLGASSTKNKIRYSEALEKYYNSDYKFSKPRTSAKNGIFK